MIRWTVEARDDGESVVALEGDITSVSFDGLLGRHDKVVLDLSGVRRLNSRGVHQFVLLLEGLARNGPVVAEMCSVAIIVQLNLLPSLAERLDVRSLFVPLECPRCFREEEVLVERKGNAKPIPDRTVCPRCNVAMQMSEPEDRYFAFLEPA